MARVDALQQKDAVITKVHDPVDATILIFEKDGATYLQIDTYGSPDRKIPAKVSQSLQFGPSGIRALKKALEGIK